MLEYHDAKVRVRYAETDQMGVVYHANFLVWFEVGRVELMRALGVEYKKMEKEDDCHIVVADVHCRFKAPAMYDDLLTIRTGLVRVRGSVLHFAYQILRAEDGEVLAEGESVHIVVDSQFQRRHLPEKYLVPFLKATGES